MGLTLDFSKSYNSTVTVINIEDTTGIYDVATNTGGWNTPNTTREDVALFLYVTYQPYTGTAVNLSSTASGTESVLDFSTDTNVTFNIDYYLDGWYSFNLIAIPAYSDAAAPGAVTANNVYYSTTASALKFYDGSSVATIEAANYATLLTSDYTKKSQDFLLTENLTKQYNCLLETFYTYLETEKEYETVTLQVNSFAAAIEAAQYRFGSEKEYEAQKIVESLTKQYKCCN